MKESRLLLIFPHPDDETLFSGGLSRRYYEAGGTVYLITVTDGARGKTSGVCQPKELAAVRRAELAQAARLLGMEPPQCLGYGDATLAGRPAEPLLGELVRHLRQVRPEAVVTFGTAGVTGHSDHQALHYLVEQAVGAAANPAYHPADGAPFAVPCRLWAALPPALQRYVGISGAEQPTAAVDTRLVAPCKQVALACHRTQQQTFARMFGQAEGLLPRFLAQETFVVKGQCPPGVLSELLSPLALPGDELTAEI